MRNVTSSTQNFGGFTRHGFDCIDLGVCGSIRATRIGIHGDRGDDPHQSKADFDTVSDLIEEQGDTSVVGEAFRDLAL